MHNAKNTAWVAQPYLVGQGSCRTAVTFGLKAKGVGVK